MTALASPPAHTTITRPNSERTTLKQSALVGPLQPAVVALGNTGDTQAVAAEAVSKALADVKHLEVTSFHDEATGRFVTRVTDRFSGQVLMQTPPDELLRFLAAKPNLDPPPTRIDA